MGIDDEGRMTSWRTYTDIAEARKTAGLPL